MVLEIRDFGRGFPEEMLEVFRAKGTNSGVGLAGMRERMRELGGQLDIQSTATGSLVSVSLPLREKTNPILVAAAD